MSDEITREDAWRSNHAYHPLHYYYLRPNDDEYRPGLGRNNLKEPTEPEAPKPPLDYDDSQPGLSHQPGRLVVTEKKPPPDDDNNAKVARHQEQAQAKLETDILNLGEAGWRSQYYTGDAYLLPTGQMTAYLRWKMARNDWTRTGKTSYLKTMEAAVDFSCPPEVPAVPAPVPEVPKGSAWPPGRQLVVTGIWTLVWLVITLIFIL